MDPIELMAIKPWQINRAIGTDRIKLVRGSRTVYNARQNRVRRGQDRESEYEDDSKLEIHPIARCTDVACGGTRRKKSLHPNEMSTMECQTDKMDMGYYFDTEEELQRQNVAVLTTRPRDIQDGVVRRSSKDSNLSVSQPGSTTSIGSQTSKKPEPKCCGPFRNLANKLKLLFTGPPVSSRIDHKPATDSEDESSTSDVGLRERDHEWLEFTSSELSRDDPQAEKERILQENPPSQTKIEQQCYEMMRALKPFWWFLKLGGRWPLQTYTEDRLIKFRFNRCAPVFFIFMISTAFLLFCTCNGTLGIVKLLGSSNITTEYGERVEKVLFNKYWVFCFVTLLYSTYACVWSLSLIFDDGSHLAQFMSRWNLGIVAINYDPLDNVRWDMWWSLGWLIFYVMSLLVFFISDAIPAVTGTSELLGIAILKSFVSYRNLDKFRLYVRGFGFFFHLYSVYAARAITLWVLMYCKLLENLARAWNLRFCFVLGMLGRQDKPNAYVRYHTVIPFTKLFNEHKLIAAFSRHSGIVFTITLTAYFALKSLEMIMLAYATCCLFIFPVELDSNQTSLPCEVKGCDPVTYVDEDVFEVMTMLYFTGQSIWGWYLTTDSIAACGQAIMSGFNFVRRYGFPRCRNAKERRFIQSLAFAYSSQTDHYINPGFTVNRKFIYDMFAWVFMMVSLIVLFSPFRLNTETVLSCSQPINGTITCTRITVPSSAKFVSDLLPTPPPSTAPKKPVTTTTGKPATKPPVATLGPTIPHVVVTPAPTLPPVVTLAPTVPPVVTLAPTLPPVVTLSTISSTEMTTTTAKPRVPAPPPPSHCTQMFAPSWYKDWRRTMDEYFQNAGPWKTIAPIYSPQICKSSYYGLIVVHYSDFETGLVYASGVKPDKPYWDLGLHGCYYACSTGHVQPQVMDDDSLRDECGNIPFRPYLTENFLPPKELVDVPVDPTKPEENFEHRWQCCCYKYDFYTGSREDLESVGIFRPFDQNGCYMRTKKEVQATCENNRKCVRFSAGKRDPSDCK